MHDPPFWQDPLQPQYDKWWRPQDPPSHAVISQHLIKTNSWFHHVQYDYPSGSRDKTLRRTESHAVGGNAPNQSSKNPHKRKAKDSAVKGKETSTKKRSVAFGSKKVVPLDCVIRNYKMRVYPTTAQKRVLRTWFTAVRHTYNWALGVLKKHYKRNLRVICPSNRMALKTQFVTCKANRMPKRLRWLRSVPYSVREESTKELSMAYSAAFARLRDGTSNQFDDIRFRSVKNQSPSAMTIPTANFSKISGKRWCFYVNSLPGKGTLRFNKRDIKRILAQNPDGPAMAVKLTMTRTGRFYMHAPLYVKKQSVPARNIGHLVAQDPGSNPYMTYYSPTRMVTGSFGTTADVLSIFRTAQNKYDKLSSTLDKNNADADWLPVDKRRKLRLRRLRIQEKVRNRVQECINKITKYFTDNYQFIHGSIFEVARMVERRPDKLVNGVTVKGKRKVARRTCRDMLTWQHGPLKQAMKGKAELIEGLVVELRGEAYTTMTCGFCGQLNNVGSAKVYKCKRCRYQVHRDVGGARGHALKNCVGKYEWTS